MRYLIDDQPELCIGCGHACFAERDCVQEPEARERSAAIEQADALALCGPVYCWQPNGLMAAMFDKVRLSTGPWRDAPQHGKPAVGLAIAGGTGSGVFCALQSMYAWFCLWKYRPLAPVPITRFNLDLALESAEALGREIASTAPRPYGGVGELLATYDALPALRYGHLEEFRWLALTIARSLERRGDSAERVAAIRATLDRAEQREHAGDRAGAGELFVAAYWAGVEVWSHS